MQNQQLSDVKGKELVAAGHAFAKAIGMDTPLIAIAKMMAELATRLDCALVRGDALAAEDVALKDTVAMLLEDARRVLKLEPNAGTESRINHALSLLGRVGKDGE